MLVKNPLNRKRWIRVNDNYDNQDIVVENSLSQKEQFKDLPKVSQLTQNSWNFSPYTREDKYNDVSVNIQNLERVDKHDRYRKLLRPDRYHEHRR